MRKLITMLTVMAVLTVSLLCLGSCSAGTDGLTPTIGENGNWWIGDTDTGVSATGAKGDTGAEGTPGAEGAPGAQGNPGAPAPTPTFRYNVDTNDFEISYDNGTTWEAIPYYPEKPETPVVIPGGNGGESGGESGGTPSGPSGPTGIGTSVVPPAGVDTFSFPVDQLELGKGTIYNKNGNYIGTDGYLVAFINLDCFEGFRYVDIGVNSLGWASYCFVKEMPEIGKKAAFCDGYTKLIDTPDDVTHHVVEIPADAMYLVVYATDSDCTPKDVRPSSLTFYKNAVTE